MNGPMIMTLLLMLAGVTILFEIMSRTRDRTTSDLSDDHERMQVEIDRLEDRLRSIERIVTDPDDRLKRRIDRL